MVITPLPCQAIKIKTHLYKKGFRNIQTQYKDDGESKEYFLDGIGLLLKDENFNLGWRIVAEHILNKKELKISIEKSYSDKSPFKELIDKDQIQYV